MRAPDGTRARLSTTALEIADADTEETRLARLARSHAAFESGRPERSWTRALAIGVAIGIIASDGA